jgi:hypothetical protein
MAFSRLGESFEVGAFGKAKLARMGEDSRTILGDVFVEQDARLDATQEARQRCLAVKEGALAQILAIMLDQVEGIEDRVQVHTCYLLA